MDLGCNNKVIECYMICYLRIIHYLPSSGSQIQLGEFLDLYDLIS